MMMVLKENKKSISYLGEVIDPPTEPPRLNVLYICMRYHGYVITNQEEWNTKEGYNIDIQLIVFIPTFDITTKLVITTI